MKVALSEIKKNIQGTNSGGDEPENQINVLELKKGKNIQSEHEEEKRILKKGIGDKLRNLWDIFKCTNICIIGMPEGDEKEQEI